MHAHALEQLDLDQLSAAPAPATAEPARQERPQAPSPDSQADPRARSSGPRPAAAAAVFSSGRLDASARARWQAPSRIAGDEDIIAGDSHVQVLACVVGLVVEIGPVASSRSRA
jgi:hypothetical protein